MAKKKETKPKVEAPKKESPLKRVTDRLFKNKSNWDELNDLEKNQAFFIINQFMAKSAPMYSLKLNRKGLLPEIGTEIWNIWSQNLKYTPDWFWKVPKKVEIEKTKLDPIDHWILKNIK
jgi:hypothetical protein